MFPCYDLHELFCFRPIKNNLTPMLIGESLKKIRERHRKKFFLFTVPYVYFKLFSNSIVFFIRQKDNGTCDKNRRVGSNNNTCNHRKGKVMNNFTPQKKQGKKYYQCGD